MDFYLLNEATGHRSAWSSCSERRECQWYDRRERTFAWRGRRVAAPLDILQPKHFFHKMQLGRDGKCSACKGGRRTTNLKPHQPLTSLISSYADPRFAGRLDGKQGGDTIIMMERVGEAIAFNEELADESTWLWLTSEQMGFLLVLRSSTHLSCR